jgi:hypothetical protein
MAIDLDGFRAQLAALRPSTPEAGANQSLVFFGTAVRICLLLRAGVYSP